MSTLNLSNYKTVWNDNFTQSNSLPSNFGVVWGSPSEYSFSNKGVTITSNGNAAGFLTADKGASNGNGYGLYSATFSMPMNQGNGAYICLWPGSNIWPGPEIDFVEQLGANDQPYMTVHWKGANGSNQYQSFNFNANLANPTTVALDWEKGSLTFYVNGTELVKYVSGGSVPIPADYADGGQNLAFGVGNVAPAGSSITISNMSYSAYSGGGGSTPTNITLTGDNMYTNSAAGTVVGTLSATDAHAVSFSLVSGWSGLFAVKGNELVLTRAMPTSPHADYFVTVNATDSSGGTASKTFKIPTLTPPAAAAVQTSNALAATAPITHGAVDGAATSHFLAAGGTGLVTSPITVLGGGGTGSTHFGLGNATVSGGTGAWGFTYGAGDGLETITNFSLAKGDVLNIDHTLQGTMHESSVGGGTMLSFGDASHGIMLQGVPSLSASNLHWF